jgi:S1-C subfamily serine protease
MLRYAPGEKVKVQYFRDKGTKSVDIKVGNAPAETAMNQVQPKRQQIDPEEIFPNLKGFDQDFGFKVPDGQKDVPPVREGKAKLGVVVKDLDSALRKQYNIPSSVKGAVVTSVSPNSVAEGIGMRPGDVIERIGLVKVQNAADITKAMDSVKWGDTRQMRISRYGDGSQTSLDVPVNFR